MNLRDIHDLLKEVRDDQKKHGEELVRHGVHLSNLERDVGQNTQDLKEHMRRTALLETMYQEHHHRIINNEKICDTNDEKITDHDKRITLLEMPIKVAKYAKEKYKGIITLITITAAAGTAVVKFWDQITSFFK